MKTNKLLIALIALMLYIGNWSIVLAQSGLSLAMQNYTVQPSNGIVSFGYTITISATLTNTDSIPFSGQVDYGMRNSQQILSNNAIFSKPFYSGDSIQLGGGESVPTLFSVNIETPFFIAGPDVVVVWPISNVNFSDSILINLLIEEPTNIDQKVVSPSEIQVFGEYITFPENTFKQVRIFNYSGSLLHSLDVAQLNYLPIDFLPQGFYILEATTTSKQQIVKKFIR